MHSGVCDTPLRLYAFPVPLVSPEKAFAGGVAYRCGIVSEGSGGVMHRYGGIPEASVGAAYRYGSIPEGLAGAMQGCVVTFLSHRI